MRRTRARSFFFCVIVCDMVVRLIAYPPTLCKPKQYQAASARSFQPPDGGCGASLPIVPIVRLHHVLQVEAMCPADLLEHGARVEGGHVSQAENGDRTAPSGHTDQLPQCLGIEQRYPAHADVFRTRGQPQILDRAGNRREIHVRHGPSSKKMRFSTVGEGGDQHPAAFENALDLEAHEFVLTLAERPSRLQTLSLHESMNPCPERPVTNADESPGLHQADAGREMCRAQQPCQQGIVERVREKMPDVAPQGHDPIYGGYFFCREITRTHVFRTSLQRTADVSAETSYIANNR